MKKHLLALATLCIAFSVDAQRTIYGTVSDPIGNKIIGANISVKGTSIGTITDSEGKFNLIVPSENKILIISYTGYEAKEIELGISNSIDAVLLEGVLLETAVVTALGISREKKSLGYSVAEIKGSDLQKVRDPNIVNQLSGRAAGVTVIGSNGNFGSSSRITVRGIKSISGNNQPLFVVDGVPMDNSNFTNNEQIQGFVGNLYNSEYDYGNSIQDINPDDVDKINILKGQAAAALYGSRGANGVVMIITKKGKQSKQGLGITLNSSITFDQVAVFPEFQNTYGGGVDLLPRGYIDNSGYYKTPFIEFGPDGDTVGIFQSFDLVPIYSVDESNGTRFKTSTDEHFKHLDDLIIGANKLDQYQFINGYGNNQDRLHFRDWNSWDSWDTKHFGLSRLWEAGDDPIEFFETGVTVNNNIAFEGSNENSSYRLSYGRFDQKGIYPNSRMNRNTICFNGSRDFSKHIVSFIGINYVNAYTKGRSASTYDYRGGLNPAQNFNQWWHTQLRFSDLKEYLNPDGTQRTWNRRSADDPYPQFWDNPYWMRYKNFQDDGRNRVFGNVGITYKINSKFSVTGRVLTDFYDEKREERMAVGSLFPSLYSLDQYHVMETNLDLIISTEQNVFNQLTLNAFIGGNKLWQDLNRNFGVTVGGLNVPDVYSIQNSKERPNILNVKSQKQIESIFGGISLGWKSQLYLELNGRQDWSSTLPDNANGYFYPSASLSYIFTEQFRIPYLTFGKLRIGVASVGGDTDPYNIYSIYSGRPNFGNNPNYTVPNTLNNNQLKPEKTQTVEIGTELQFLQNRLALDLAYYSSTTKDQIIPIASSPTSGFTKQFVNAGELRNNGIELSLNLTPFIFKDFSWNIIFNWAKNNNKVLSLIPNDPSVRSIQIGFNVVSINAYLGEPYGTIFGTNYTYDDKGNKLIYPSGDLKGTYIPTPYVMPIGNIIPDFTGGISNQLRWKNLSLSIFIDFRKGGDILSVTNINGRYSGLFSGTVNGNIRENGVVNSGKLAVLDKDGNLIQTGGIGTDTKLDDTYQSTGENNSEIINFQSADFSNGGYVVNKADLYDGSFIKLRELSLTYSFSKTWLAKLGIQDFSCSIVAKNLAFLFKNTPNIDPDSAISTSNIQGLEGGATPTTRTIGINFNLKF